MNSKSLCCGAEMETIDREAEYPQAGQWEICSQCKQPAESAPKKVVIGIDFGYEEPSKNSAPDSVNKIVEEFEKQFVGRRVDENPEHDWVTKGNPRYLKGEPQAASIFVRDALISHGKAEREKERKEIMVRAGEIFIKNMGEEKEAENARRKGYEALDGKSSQLS